MDESYDVTSNGSDIDVIMTTQALNNTGSTHVTPYEGPNMPLFRFVCEVCLSLPIAVIGICGNILAFVVLCRQKHRVTTNVFLQALAVADTLVLISAILLRSMRYVGWDAFSNIYHHIFIVLYPCVYFFRLADTWLTVMLTIDRYIAVCHPLQAQRLCTLRRTYINIAIIALTTLAFSLPRFFEYELSNSEEHLAGSRHTVLILSQTYTLLYRISLFFLAMYLCPMVLLIVLNIRLLCTLRRAYRHRHSMISRSSMHSGKSNNPSTSTASRGITIIVVTVVISCVICNVGATTAHLLWAVGECYRPLRQYLEIYRRFVANISNVLITFNCAINFVIYCMFSQKFRDGLKQTFHFQSLVNMNHTLRSGRLSTSSGSANTTYTSTGRLSSRMSSKNNIKLTAKKQKSTDL